MIAVLFGVSTFLLVYTYFIYPTLLYIVTRKIQTKVTQSSNLPSVDIIISAYNEASCIEERISNLLSQHYEGELRILVANDGSQDDTGAIITQFKSDKVSAFDFKENRGKVTILNELVDFSDAEIIVFTDANTEFEKDAVSRLISCFDDSIGGVCGELHIYDNSGKQNSDGVYWRYEQFLKERESKIGALLGANGAIYAIRRDLYHPLPTNTVVDDFCVMMNVKKQGFNTIYNPLAKAREEAAPTLSDEYGRRVRIGLGNYRALKANLWALSPLAGSVSWCFWSHKVLRWFAPHLLIVAFVSNVFLLHHSFFILTMVMQCLLYFISFIGINRINRNLKVDKLSAILSFFVNMNIALGHGFIKCIWSNETGAWTTTKRSSDRTEQ